MEYVKVGKNCQLEFDFESLALKVPAKMLDTVKSYVGYAQGHQLKADYEVACGDNGKTHFLYMQVYDIYYVFTHFEYKGKTQVSYMTKNALQKFMAWGDLV